VKLLKLLVAIAALAAISISPAGAQEVVGSAAITGAGSTFAYPIISKWSKGYQHWLAGGGEFPMAGSGLDDPPAGPVLDYEPIGSLAGMMRISDGAVDFGASDMPLKSEDLQKLGLIQFPLVIGGAVAVVNLEGVGPGQIKFTGPLLADIYLGKIRKWSDAAIAAVNPGLKLPDADIVLVHRSDGSGTTFNFTNYLSKVSTEWREKVGFELIVPWPTGLGAKGNKGVADTVCQDEELHRLRRIYSGPPEQAQLCLTPESVVATVFVLMRKGVSSLRTRNVLNFFEWSLDRGAKEASSLGYVPLPKTLVTQVKDYWAKNLKAGT